MPANLSISERILIWLNNQPQWYSAALHILINRGLLDEDVELIAMAACREAGIPIPNENAEALEIVTAEELDSFGYNLPEVAINGIENIENVNCVVSGASIPFSASGVQVIYGKNGSGKSSYARLLRGVCTSRVSETHILPNAFGGNWEDIPSAVFHVNMDGKEECIPWSGDAEKRKLFPGVLFFDGECGSIELTKQNEVLYSIPSLDLLKRFADLVSQVCSWAAHYSEKLNEKKPNIEIPREFDAIPIVTQVAQASSSQGLAELFVGIAFTESDKRRQSELLVALSSNSEKEEEQLRKTNQQLGAIRDQLRAMYKKCSKESVALYQEKISKLEVAKEASKISAEKIASESTLDGIGTDIWKSLWEAAKRYSDRIAYPNSSFPNVAGESKCPLCQQPLDDQAKQRFLSFESFMRDATEQHLRDAANDVSTMKKDFIDACNGLRKASLLLSSIKNQELQHDIEATIADLPSSTDSFEVARMPELMNRISDEGKRLNVEIAANESEISKLILSRNNLGLSKMKSELLNLRAKEWLTNNHACFLRRREIEDIQRGIARAEKAWNSRSISSLVSEIAATEVAQSAERFFSQELAGLSLGGGKIALKTLTRSGAEVQMPVLSGSTINVSPKDVLSEGEQKAIALASFFAELDMMSNSSTAILDDPINSLDQDYRESITRRIIQEGKSRPIIVFTHDPLFSSELNNEAVRCDVDFSVIQLNRYNNHSGFISEDVEWKVAGIDKKIRQLRKQSQDLRAIQAKRPEKYEDEIARGYARLRGAWECAVENELLGGVIVRFSRPVHTQRLHRAEGITSEEVKTVNYYMDRCSTLFDGHDRPLIPSCASPTPDEFAADVKALESFISDVRERRKS